MAHLPETLVPFLHSVSVDAYGTSSLNSHFETAFRYFSEGWLGLLLTSTDVPHHTYPLQGEGDNLQGEERIATSDRRFFSPTPPRKPPVMKLSVFRRVAKGPVPDPSGFLLRRRDRYATAGCFGGFAFPWGLGSSSGGPVSMSMACRVSEVHSSFGNQRQEAQA